MATNLFPAYGELRGSVGGTVFSRSASGKQTLRARVTPTNPNTVAQRSARTALGASSSVYTTLAAEAQAMWNSFAASVGTKFGRWEYVKRVNWLASINRYLMATGTGITPATQPTLDRVALLDVPKNIDAEFSITSGTAVAASFSVVPTAFSVGDNSIDFTIALDDSTKNFTSFVNPSARKLAVVFTILVQKKQSKYERVFLSLTDIVFTPAANHVDIAGAISAIPTTDFKYSIAVGSKITIRAYVTDPGANMQRILISETSLIAGV